MKNIINSEFIPKRQTTGSAGYDVYAVEDMNVERWFKTFDTGVCFDGEETPYMCYEKDMSNSIYNIYLGTWVAMLYPRSSMGFKHGLKFATTTSIIDKDYRDTIKLSIAADHPFTIKKGERYAQLIFMPHGILLEEDIPTAKRGGGIGSTDQAY